MSPDRHLRQIELCLLRCLIVIEREQTRGLEIATYAANAPLSSVRLFLKAKKERAGARAPARRRPREGSLQPSQPN